ncbi:peptide-methionine (S)-S-oxide reductase [Kangiella taiwanensis]|uniref:peptide-methionine (S)-S-oxide reductase n=1 Tax=Kangiella taiwanensis TaxID=1079179 RepID=A0ABP8I4R0_9GAMM|nr:peptide-methionine (S)-S-oxide reductase [Kangiella taiwanensis]
MTVKKEHIGFGGGCHWCTEAVFANLKGVSDVKQGWIASDGDASSFSEAVLLRFDPDAIPMKDLIHIHLLTHSSTSMHAFREKYRSAVYTFNPAQASEAKSLIAQLANADDKRYITQVLPFRDFKLNDEKYQQYYLKHADKPFCKTYIDPKLAKLKSRYSRHLKGA